MRQNDTQRAPQQTLKGGQNCLIILKKVALRVSSETPWPQSCPAASHKSIVGKTCFCIDFFYAFRICYCVSSILFLICCSMVSVLYISKRNKQNNQSKQSNHRKSRKASKACKVSNANIFGKLVDDAFSLGICLLKLQEHTFVCLLMLLAPSLLCVLFTLFRSRSHRRFPVPLSKQV